MTPQDKASPSMLTTKEFAQQSGQSVATVQKHLRSGKLNGTKIGNRWYISPNELPASARTEGSTAPPRQAAGNSGGAAAGSRKAASPAAYSVAEFSRLTYLTELGVKRWLQSGRLQGEKTAEGVWRVLAQNLDLPHVKLLIR